MRLTDESIRRHVRPTTGQTFAWDDLVSGFGVRFTPTVAAYIVQWRAGDGRKIRKTLARWPAMSVADAREHARKELGQAVIESASGGDKPLRAAMRAWYDLNVSRDQWRKRYADKVDSTIRVYIEGVPSSRVRLSPGAVAAIDQLGRKSVSAVKAGDVLAVADGMKQGAAEQFMAVISSFYGFAMDREWALGNPARNRLRKTGGRLVRDRLLTDGEFVELWRAFEAEGDPAFGAFAVLAYTGARRSEVTEMRWAEVDLKAATWTIPPERRKSGKKDRAPFVIDLAPAVVRIIKRQPVLDGSPFVFWGRRDKRPFDFHHALTDRIVKAVKVKDWRIHDLRRYMRSGLGRLGVSQTVAEMCLGHIAKSGLVAVYDQHSYEKEKRAAWLKWARHVDELTR